ncbi:MAG: 4-(cytidine 5'-diphospho)-2-C-methyl-D-erythritol kinase [Planctomycetota bacterium]|jgi:4-diphosphocytidyl-2-C-methyl-D-erythritol kinase
MAEGAEHPTELEVRAPAKINLYLEVLGQRPDGFHEIRTVMQAVSLCDELSFSARGDGQVVLSCSSPDLPLDDRNLVVRAARLLKGRYGTEQGASVELHKRIPVGGGLGGGSADCAVTLLALNRLWGLGVPLDELTETATELGSDVPFFLWGGTALCEGRGERVSPLPCLQPMHYVLVMPPYSVATGQVYSAAETALTGWTGGGNNVVEALRDGDAELLGDALRNDLQAAALALHEGLQEVFDRLEEMGAAHGGEGLLLSGSGAAFLLVVPGEEEARRAADALASRLGVACAAVHSLPAWDGRLSQLTLGRTHL